MGLFDKKPKFTCHVCGEVYKEDLPTCGKCMTNMKDQSEQLIYRSYCNWAKGGVSNPDGALFLTNMRLFFIKNESNTGATTGYIAGGLIGAAIGAAVDSASGSDAGIAVLVPLEQIASIQETRKSMRKAISVHTKAGEEITLIPKNLKDWLPHLQLYMA